MCDTCVRICAHVCVRVCVRIYVLLRFPCLCMWHAHVGFAFGMGARGHGARGVCIRRPRTMLRIFTPWRSRLDGQGKHAVWHTIRRVAHITLNPIDSSKELVARPKWREVCGVIAAPGDTLASGARGHLTPFMHHRSAESDPRGVMRLWPSHAEPHPPLAPSTASRTRDVDAAPVPSKRQSCL